MISSCIVEANMSRSPCRKSFAKVEATKVLPYNCLNVQTSVCLPHKEGVCMQICRSQMSLTHNT